MSECYLIYTCIARCLQSKMLYKTYFHFLLYIHVYISHYCMKHKPPYIQYILQFIQSRFICSAQHASLLKLYSTEGHFHGFLPPLITIIITCKIHKCYHTSSTIYFWALDELVSLACHWWVHTKIYCWKSATTLLLYTCYFILCTYYIKPVFYARIGH